MYYFILNLCIEREREKESNLVNNLYDNNKYLLCDF